MSEAMRAALRLEDWSALNSLLNREAIERLRRAGWIIYLGRLTQRGLQSAMLDGCSARATAAQASAIRENLLSYHARSPAAQEAKLSAASRELCEFFGVDLRASPSPPATDRGGWVLYKDGRVALFLEASACPDPMNPKFSINAKLARQIRGLDLPIRLSGSESEVGREEAGMHGGMIAGNDLRKYFPELTFRSSCFGFVYRHMRVCETTGIFEILFYFHIVTDFESVSFKVGDNLLLLEIDGDYKIHLRDGSGFKGKRLQAKLWNAMTGLCDFDCLGWEIELYDDENVRREFDNGDDVELV
jgi:hypothetical protein